MKKGSHHSEAALKHMRKAWTVRGEMPERYPFPIANPPCDKADCPRRGRKMWRASRRGYLLQNSAACEIVKYRCGHKYWHWVYLVLPGGQRAKRVGRGHYQFEVNGETFETVAQEPASKKPEVRQKISDANVKALSSPKMRKKLRRIARGIWKRKGNKQRRHEQGKRMADLRAKYTLDLRADIEAAKRILADKEAELAALEAKLGRPRTMTDDQAKYGPKIAELRAQRKSWTQVRSTMNRETGQDRSVSGWRHLLPETLPEPETSL